MLQTFRLLLLGSGGSGKTELMLRMMNRFPFAGVIGDPLDEYAAAPTDRYQRFDSFWSSDINQLVDIVTNPEAETPMVMFLDEVHRIVKQQDTIQSSPTLTIMDIARNLGLHWIVSSKQATLLPTLITTLATHVAINPPRTPAVQRWLAQAGIHFDINEGIPDFHWILAEPKKQPTIVSSDDLLRIAEEFLAFGPVAA